MTFTRRFEIESRSGRLVSFNKSEQEGMLSITDNTSGKERLSALLDRDAAYTLGKVLIAWAWRAPVSRGTERIQDGE
jgi:hypothetical protein